MDGYARSWLETSEAPYTSSSFLGRALALRGGEDDLTAVQLKGYPETLSSGAQVLIPDYEANEQILQDFRE